MNEKLKYFITQNIGPLIESKFGISIGDVEFHNDFVEFKVSDCDETYIAEIEKFTDYDIFDTPYIDAKINKIWIAVYTGESIIPLELDLSDAYHIVEAAKDEFSRILTEEAIEDAKKQADENAIDAYIAKNS